MTAVRLDVEIYSLSHRTALQPCVSSLGEGANGFLGHEIREETRGGMATFRDLHGKQGDLFFPARESEPQAMDLTKVQIMTCHRPYGRSGHPAEHTHFARSKLFHNSVSNQRLRLWKPQTVEKV